MEKIQVRQGKGQPHGHGHANLHGHANSSLDLYLPPETPFKALFDMKKEARVSTCFLLQEKGGKVDNISQLATLTTLLVRASPSKTWHSELGL